MTATLLGWFGRSASVALVVMAVARPAYAQASLSVVGNEAGAIELTLPVSSSPLAMSAQLAQPPGSAPTGASSSSFVALQIAFGALEALDVYSTMRGVDAGLTEANPLVRGAASRHPVAFSAAKAAAASTSLYLLRHVAKRHRPLALITLAAMNATYAVVVARNLRVAGAR